MPKLHQCNYNMQLFDKQYTIKLVNLLVCPYVIKTNNVSTIYLLNEGLQTTLSAIATTFI